MTSLLFHGGRLLDPRLDTLVEGVEVLIAGDCVREVSWADGAPSSIRGSIRADHASRIDLGGRTLMPGLIDAHVHIFITKLPLAALEGRPLTWLAGSASVLMRQMLMRGFTTVRDTAGGDFGMKAACEAAPSRARAFSFPAWR
jgi:imidazolonepropionase-like amidohydrolase